jgi:hypothetical protein
MKAEAACQQQNYQQAMTLLLKLGAKRDSLYASRLSECTDSNLFNIDTQVEIVSLMDEILFQRRVELWCEGLGRCFDLRRLNLGYDRNYSGSNHTCLIKLLPGDSRYSCYCSYECENKKGIDETKQKSPLSNIMHHMRSSLIKKKYVFLYIKTNMYKKYILLLIVFCSCGNYYGRNGHLFRLTLELPTLLN